MTAEQRRRNNALVWMAAGATALLGVVGVITWSAASNDQHLHATAAASAVAAAWSSRLGGASTPLATTATASVDNHVDYSKLAPIQVQIVAGHNHDADKTASSSKMPSWRIIRRVVDDENEPQQVMLTSFSEPKQSALPAGRYLLQPQPSTSSSAFMRVTVGSHVLGLVDTADEWPFEITPKDCVLRSQPPREKQQQKQQKQAQSSRRGRGLQGYDFNGENVNNNNGGTNGPEDEDYYPSSTTTTTSGSGTASSSMSSSASSSSSSPADSPFSYKLHITPDGFPEETYWRLYEQRSDAFSYFEIAGGSNLTYAGTLPGPGTYALEVLDSFGDGICCLYEEGRIRLTVNDRVAIDHNGVFEESTGVLEFSVSSTGMVDSNFVNPIPFIPEGCPVPSPPMGGDVPTTVISRPPIAIDVEISAPTISPVSLLPPIEPVVIDATEPPVHIDVIEVPSPTSSPFAVLPPIEPVVIDATEPPVHIDVIEVPSPTSSPVAVLPPIEPVVIDATEPPVHIDVIEVPSPTSSPVAVLPPIEPVVIDATVPPTHIDVVEVPPPAVSRTSSFQLVYGFGSGDMLAREASEADFNAMLVVVSNYLSGYFETAFAGSEFNYEGLSTSASLVTNPTLANWDVTVSGTGVLTEEQLQQTIQEAFASVNVATLLSQDLPVANPYYRSTVVTYQMASMMMEQETVIVPTESPASPVTPPPVVSQMFTFRLNYALGTNTPSTQAQFGEMFGVANGFLSSALQQAFQGSSFTFLGLRLSGMPVSNPDLVEFSATVDGTGTLTMERLGAAVRGGLAGAPQLMAFTTLLNGNLSADNPYATATSVTYEDV